MQTVADLLKQFDLKLELPENILNMMSKGNLIQLNKKMIYFILMKI